MKYFQWISHKQLGWKIRTKSGCIGLFTFASWLHVTYVVVLPEEGEELCLESDLIGCVVLS